MSEFLVLVKWLKISLSLTHIPHSYLDLSFGLPMMIISPPIDLNTNDELQDGIVIRRRRESIDGYDIRTS